MAPILALADDLSGAAETAAALSTRETRNYTDPDVPRLLLLTAHTAHPHPHPAPGGALVVDTDSRHRDEGEAAARVRAALSLAEPPSTGAPVEAVTVLKKIDSLLRGRLAAELGPLRERGGLVLAPALPVAGRTVLDGAVRVDGGPLSAAPAWRLEPTRAPDDIASALAPLPCRTVPLALVRGPETALSRALRDAVTHGMVAVCDAVSDDDLTRIATVTRRALGSGVALAGSAAMAGALARTTTPSAPAPGAPRQLPPADHPRPLLLVVGTAEPSARRQTKRLARAGVPVLSLPGTELLTDPGAAATALAAAARHPVSAVTLAETLVEAPPGALTGALADAVARSGTPADLVLTGGATARAVIDALGHPTLAYGGPIHRPERPGEVEYGAVRLLAPDGRTVVTRPGSFGGPDSLLTIARSLRPVARGHSPVPPGPADRP
ncbi:four-carbon acid sugar kinase family protein [Streptomyces sp. DSM 44915]|uniref:Four-carbon acid sugar kinase family protein n=1 Tax=Streptomyces chisholmiae TaxID=3075540 RepID=A0ABU2JTL6_9ACTN|nr:four-carbon acid sugar kinase family protein [Streptomyces sp. DSM 44915]MDT0267533.1 four-carbon acid sugar kinase family protein [Streptomyces sp. DSM 44915]